jgi:hypothetical protein
VEKELYTGRLAQTLSQTGDAEVGRKKVSVEVLTETKSAVRCAAPRGETLHRLKGRTGKIFESVRR